MLEKPFPILVLLLGVALIAVEPSGQSELEGRFTTGIVANVPRAGASCMGSTAALGTSNIATSTPNGVLGGKASTVVNIWAIDRKFDGSAVGWIAKTHDGILWYEPPVQGLRYEKLDEAASHQLANQPLTFTSCFQSDFAP